MTRRSVDAAITTIALVTGAILLGGCAVQAPPATARSISYSTTPVIRDGRFIVPFALDGATLVVSPVSKGYTPVRSLASVATEAWATSELGGERPTAVGLGRVTIATSARGVPVVRHLVAWVALSSRGVQNCTAFTPPTPRQHPPSSGWSAVVLGDAVGAPAVVFAARSIICGSYVPARLQNAEEVISVPWNLTPMGVVARVPSCSALVGSDFGSTPRSTSFGHEVAVPEQEVTPAIPGAMPTCLPQGATVLVALADDPEARGVVRSTIHERTGPQSQVGSVVTDGREAL